MIYNFFVILIVVAALLMIGIVLIQESKGGGLASNFSSSNAFMGVRKTTDFIEKTTWGLAVAMVVLSVICAYAVPSAATAESVLENTPVTEQQTNPTNLPGFGTGQTQGQDGAQKTDGKEAQKPAASEKAPAATKEAPAAPAAEKPAPKK